MEKYYLYPFHHPMSHSVQRFALNQQEANVRKKSEVFQMTCMYTVLCQCVFIPKLLWIDNIQSHTRNLGVFSWNIQAVVYYYWTLLNAALKGQFILDSNNNKAISPPLFVVYSWLKGPEKCNPWNMDARTGNPWERNDYFNHVWC